LQKARRTCFDGGKFFTVFAGINMDTPIFKKKIDIFSNDYLKCCKYLCKVEPVRENFTKKLYAEMVAASKLLEDFLDFHGAKNNSDWYFYRELVASVRNLAAVSYSQKHIFNRVPSYELYGHKDFKEKGFNTHKFLIRSLRNISAASLDEAERLNIYIPPDNFSWEDFPGISTGEVFDFNIDDQDTVEEKKNIVKITTKFLNVVKDFELLGFYEPYPIETIKTIVPSGINEEEMRRFEMVVHNLQSTFDTYVNRSALRFRNIKLKRLRGFISIVLHLMELTGRLLHYYERHLYEMGYKNVYQAVGERLMEMVGVDQILDSIVNYGLYYICKFLTLGQDLAREVLNENIERSAIKVGIPLKMGFHSRPSLLVAKIVQHYGGEVELCVREDRFDAGSVLDIQWAGGKIAKEEVEEVVFEGDVRALNDIKILAGVNYGEDTMGKGIPLPKELLYLRH
jgi:phosphotransferase system HPr-like phosphotransfer protein